MYELRSGNRNITLPEDNVKSKDSAIKVASQIVLGHCSLARLRRPGDRPPRSIRLVGVKGSAKNATPVEVVAKGRRRERVEVRKAA